jgi:hypothetical protein
MRTDPQADEVREIVTRVFASYQQRRKPPHAAAFGGKNRFAGQFPRIHEPEDEDLSEGSPDDHSAEIDETILIDQGRYVARSYRIEGYLAMWLVPVGIVQFYDDHGRMLETINLFELLRPQRMAA